MRRKGLGGPGAPPMTTTTDILRPGTTPELIGRGGMGEIYRAEDELLGRTVAARCSRRFRRRFASGRFTREALAAARLSVNRTRSRSSTSESTRAGRSSSWSTCGGSLEDRLREHGAQDPGRVLAWLDEAGAALDAAHDHGVVHRDVKPGNLLLAGDGTVRVADFGVASAAGLDAHDDGDDPGTAATSLPSRRGEPTTPATDLYALAVVASSS